MLDFPRVTGGLAVAIALLALVATVGGTSYAAARIAANSVGTPQLKDDAVTSAKIENRSLKAVDLKAGLAKKHVTEIDVSMGLGTKEDAIRVPGVGLMDLFCVSNQVYTYLEKKSGAMSNALVITGVRTDDGNPALLGGTGYENLQFSGGTSFSVSLALVQRGTPVTAHLDLYGVRTGDTCRFSGQIVS